MNFVELIRDRKKIAQINNQLRGHHRYRDLSLFVVGINTTLRISDLLELRVEHFQKDDSRISRRFWTEEHNWGKRQDVVVNNNIQKVLEGYHVAPLELSSDLVHCVF